MNNTCGDRDCFVCYPEDPSILAENKILKEALEKIADEAERVYLAYSDDDTKLVHLGMSIIIAQEALKKISA